MKQQFRLTFITCLMIFSPFAFAETPLQQQDFAYVATLSEGTQSLRQCELPYAILAGLERQDYGDMRIFNSQHQPVPFSISQIEPQSYQNKSVYEVHFFRLADHLPQHDGLEINFSETSTRLNFNTVNNSEHVNYLLLENQHQTDDLQTIKLDWQQPSAAFSIKVKVESSDDLQSWQTVTDSVTLYDLKYAQTALVENKLPLPASFHAKYLRLSFLPSSDFSLQINKITGEYQHTTYLARENTESFRLEPGEHPNEWLFNTGSFIPLTKIEFQIPATGLFYRGSLYSKNDSASQNSTRIATQHSFKHDLKRALHHRPEYQTTPQDNWRYQGAVTQYRLLTASGEIRSDPIAIAVSTDKQWKIVLEQPISLLPEQVPTVKVAWQSVKVTFLAQGNPPYQLFFGNAAMTPTQEVLPPLVNSADVETIEIQEIQPIATEVVASQPEYLQTNAEKARGQKLILWLLLCAGVVAMAVMAYRLYGQMNQKKE